MLARQIVDCTRSRSWLHLRDVEDLLRASPATPKREGGDGSGDDSQGGTSGDRFIDDPAEGSATVRTARQRESGLRFGQSSTKRHTHLRRRARAERG